MLLSQHQCLIISVGDVKESNGFKKCFVRVKTKELRDEVSGEVIRQAGEFDCEVSVGTGNNISVLKESAGLPDQYLPCTFILRSFFYKEKGIEKLGKQLQLKRWWR